MHDAAAVLTPDVLARINAYWRATNYLSVGDLSAGQPPLALSNGESSDMAELLTSASELASFAVDYFCRQVQSAIGAFAATAGGIDALVFSGGIGENAPQIRERICEPLHFLDLTLDAEANQDNRGLIQSDGFKRVLRITANEEDVIRERVEVLLSLAASD